MKLSLKHILPSLALIAAVVLRTVQDFFLTDPENGFIKHKFSILGTIISAVVFILIALVPLLASRISLNEKKEQSSSNFIAVSSALLSIAIIFGLLSDSFIITTPAWSLLLSCITGVCAALFFAFLGIVPFFKIAVNPALYIIPLIYFTAKTVSVFASMTNIVSAVDHTLLLGAYCTECLFFLEIAKNKNGATEKSNLNKILVLGSLEVAFGLVYCIPAILGLFANAGLHEELYSVIEIFCSTLFTISLTSDFFEKTFKVHSKV